MRVGKVDVGLFVVFVADLKELGHVKVVAQLDLGIVHVVIDRAVFADLQLAFLQRLEILLPGQLIDLHLDADRAHVLGKLLGHAGLRA